MSDDRVMATNTLDTIPALAEGVWALVDRDHCDTITAVYPSELDALRVLNSRGYGRVAPLEWGESLGGGLR